MFSAIRGPILASILLVSAGVSADRPAPSLDSAGGKGSFSCMQMLLEKTVLKVDVLTVDVRMGKKEQEKLAAVGNGKTFEEKGAELANIAIAANDAVVQLKFARSVSLDQWLAEVRRNLQQARDAGLITPETQQQVGDALPGRFAALSKIGFKAGDRVLYHVQPKSVRTVAVQANGNKVVDFSDSDDKIRRVVMASYLAPKSDFRDPLLRSLFTCKS